MKIIRFVLVFSFSLLLFSNTTHATSTYVENLKKNCDYDFDSKESSATLYCKMYTKELFLSINKNSSHWDYLNYVNYNWKTSEAIKRNNETYDELGWDNLKEDDMFYFNEGLKYVNKVYSESNDLDLYFSAVVTLDLYYRSATVGTTGNYNSDNVYSLLPLKILDKADIISKQKSCLPKQKVNLKPIKELNSLLIELKESKRMYNEFVNKPSKVILDGFNKYEQQISKQIQERKSFNCSKKSLTTKLSK